MTTKRDERRSIRVGETATLRNPLDGEHVRHDEIDSLIALTNDPRPLARGRAVKRLCPCHVQADDARVWDRLLAMAADPDAYVRAQVLHALGDGSPRAREADVVRAVEGMRNDPDPSLRRRVRRLLATYRRTGQINVL